MSESNSTQSAKPSKPYAEYPLTAHPAGYWCKKIRGKLYYFGPWNDPQGALDKYLKDKDALHAGRKPRADITGVVVKDVVNAFLIHKDALIEAGELSPRTRSEYQVAGDLVVEHLGKHCLVSDIGPDDFAPIRKSMAKHWGPERLGKIIQYIRSIFKHGYEEGLIDRPVRFGPGFKRPSKKVLRLNRAKQGPKLFTAEEIGKLLDAAGVQLKAMLLLAINAGFGNSDCANLPVAAVNLETGWIDYPRPKTGIPRKCKLWPETAEALKEAIAHRPEPKKAEHADLLFITKYGDSWGKDTSDNPISKEVAKLLKSLHINGRKGLGFYTLRHCFETVGGETRDQVAVDAIMGHADDSMAGHYRERISDERLVAVANTVRKWLFEDSGRTVASGQTRPHAQRL